MDNLNFRDFDRFFRGALANINQNRDVVNKLNVFPVPDGDTGTNMFLTLNTAIEEVEKRKPKNLKEFGKALCEGALIGGRGNSGVITSQILKGFFEPLDNLEIVDTMKFSEALSNGAKVAYQAVIKPVEGTILTVIKYMANKALSVAPYIKDFDDFLKQIIDEGNKTLAKTPEMLNVLKEAGVVDAGGQGLIFMFEGGLSALRGEEIKRSFEETIQEIDSSTLEGELKFKFDTVILLKNIEVKTDNLQDFLQDFGDSIVVAQAGELTKVHIHSNEPYKVIQEVMRYGNITEAKIENMQLEQEEFLQKKKEENPSVSRFPFSIVSVVQGEGFKEIFKSLGAEFIIEGGQTMNPSINDFVNCIEKTSRDNVIIFPNNSNVILAAKEAKKIAKNKKVEIIPTVNMVQAIPAFLVFNSDASFEENVKNAEKTIKRIHSISITYSIRDTKINGLMISTGDVIGMFDNEILTKAKTPEDAVFDILQKKKDIISESGFLAIYYGRDVDKETAEKLLDKIHSEFSEIEADITFGGQPYYYYLISIEWGD